MGYTVLRIPDTESSHESANTAPLGPAARRGDWGATSLRGQVVTHNELGQIRTVAGVDISTAGKRAHAAIVVLRFPELEPLEAVEAELPLSFSLRSGPAGLSRGAGDSGRCARAADRARPVHVRWTGAGSSAADGHRQPCRGDPGQAQHRLRQVAAVRAVWRSSVPEWAIMPRSWTRARLSAQRCARARTREPVYVSIGHKVDLPTAISYVLRCCSGYRLPEPTRWAHRVAGVSQAAGALAGQEKLS